MVGEGTLSASIAGRGEEQDRARQCHARDLSPPREEIHRRKLPQMTAPITSASQSQTPPTYAGLPLVLPTLCIVGKIHQPVAIVNLDVEKPQQRESQRARDFGADLVAGMGEVKSNQSLVFFFQMTES